MKLSLALVGAAMMVGSAALIGCSSNVADQAANELTESKDDSTADAADWRGRASFGSRFYGTHYAQHSYWRGSFSQRYYSPYVGIRYAPPRARYEYIGRAPSSRHFWVNGYQRWNGREYLWVGGHWDARRNGSTYVQPHYDVVGGRYRFIPGHWA